jgi:hypothetical protein
MGVILAQEHSRYVLASSVQRGHGLGICGSAGTVGSIQLNVFNTAPFASSAHTSAATGEIITQPPLVTSSLSTSPLPSVASTFATVANA